jgi:hypothetical protein
MFFLLSFMFFSSTKSENRRMEQVLPGGRRGGVGWGMWHMHVNANLRPGMGRGEVKESRGGVNSSMIYLIHCKKICKYPDVPPPSTIIKKFKTSVSKSSMSLKLSALTVFQSIKTFMVGAGTLSYKPSVSGSSNQEDHGLKTAQENSS